MPRKELTKEELAYWEKARKHPVNFMLPKSESEAAWGRAQSFVGLYSSMKIQTASDYVLQTYNATSYGQFSYNIVRSPMGDSVMFKVECDYKGIGLAENATRNLQVCAYHIGTGSNVMASLLTQ